MNVKNRVNSHTSSISKTEIFLDFNVEETNRISLFSAAFKDVDGKKEQTDPVPNVGISRQKKMDKIFGTSPKDPV